MSVFEMALAFNWEIPATLLYGFRTRTGEGTLEPVPINGSSLAQGRFLVDQFARSGDSFTFQLYEWTAGQNPTSLHSGLRLFKIEAENFELQDLFATPPIFRGDEILDSAEPVPANESPFPGLPNLFRWVRTPFATQHFPIVPLQEEQVFRFRAKAVVASLIKEPGRVRRVRTFLFDPEMIVGDDGSEPVPTGG